MRTETNRASDAPHAVGDPLAAQFAADVQYYLARSPRQLPSRYFYDEVGSTLFEAICRLPWYGITRAESRLIADHRGEIFRRIPSLSTIVELGSGSGDKLRALIDTADRPRSALSVHLVDVSRNALTASQRLLGELDLVEVAAHQAAYEIGLGEAMRQPEGRGRALVLFLGSNIGNFDPPGAAALLHSVRARLAAGDALLLGADLMKSERDLVLAYDDPLGVTAAFNRNLLLRINQELGGNFNLDQFAHRAVWSAAESRVEMHLVVRSAQQIHVEGAQLDFCMKRDEPIWTESSYKHQPENVVGLVEAAGFGVVAQWIDRRDLFALTLAEAV